MKVSELAIEPVETKGDLTLVKIVINR